MSNQISQLVAPSGVNHASFMAFIRDQSTSVAEDLKQTFLVWVEQERVAGREVDEELVARVVHDFDFHHRLTPETIQNVPHAIYVSLNHMEGHHYGRE